MPALSVDPFSVVALSVRAFARWRLVTALGVIAAAPLGAQTAPSPDVFLVPLSVQNSAWRVGVPANLTRYAGYDNQPVFAPDGRALFVTRTMPDAQADIIRVDFGTGVQSVAYPSKESEYSARPLTASNGTVDALAVVRVELDSTQRLWRVPLDGSAGAPLVSGVKPVGYFTFPDDTLVAMFVLPASPNAPPTLQIGARDRDGRAFPARTIAQNIGRSLHTIPGSTAFSYVQKSSVRGAPWYVVRYTPSSGKHDTLAVTRPNREDMAWLDSTTMITGDGAQLYTRTLRDSAWTLLGDFAFAGVSDITRIAVGPSVQGRAPQWLAIAAVPPVAKVRASGPVTLREDERTQAGQVRRDIFILAADSMEGRKTGTPGGDRAARWLAQEFAAAGLAPAGDSGTYLQQVPLQTPVTVTPGGRNAPRLLASWAAWDSIAPDQRLRAANVVGVIEGADPARKDEVVLVTAHYDHIGIGRAVDGDSINNGADDDASGTIGLLHLARAMARGPKPARTIVFAAVTGEEVGLLGTKWYIAHPVRALERTVANFNLEMIGRPDTLTGGAGTVWLTGYERSTVGDMLADAGVPIVADPRPAQRFFERSDNIDFARRGIPAHTLSTYNLHPEYHTVRDGPETIDTAHMARVIDAALLALRTLVNSDAVPTWHPGGRP